jgi:hypothetical protein
MIKFPYDNQHPCFSGLLTGLVLYEVLSLLRKLYLAFFG